MLAAAEQGLRGTYTSAFSPFCPHSHKVGVDEVVGDGTARTSDASWAIPHHTVP